jgi:hypothetical protein
LFALLESTLADGSFDTHIGLIQQKNVHAYLVAFLRALNLDFERTGSKLNIEVFFKSF